MPPKKSKKSSKSANKQTPVVLEPDVATVSAPTRDEPESKNLRKDIEDAINMELINGFKNVFFAKNEEEMVKATNTLSNSYNKICFHGTEEMLDYYFQVFDIRMGYFLKLPFGEEGLFSAFECIAGFAVGKQGAGDQKLVDRLISLLEYGCDCVNYDIRANGVALAGILINASRRKGGTRMNLSFEKRHYMTEEQLQSLYKLLIDRGNDQPEIRSSVLLGMKTIMNDPVPNSIPEMMSVKPRDYLMKCLRDPDENVRTTAVKCTLFDGEKDYAVVMRLAMTDDFTGVRFAALARIGLVSPRLLPFKERLPFLYYTLLDNELAITEAVRVLIIDKYVQHYQETYGKLMSLMSRSNDGEVSNSTVNRYSNDLECDYMAPAIALMVFQFELEKDPKNWMMADLVTLTTIDRARHQLFQPDDPLAGFIRVLIIGRHSKDFMPFLHRSNFETILDLKSNADSFMRTISHLIVQFPEHASYIDCFRFRVVYIWLAFMHYIHKKSIDDEDRQKCFFEMAPDLSTACYIVSRLLDEWAQNPVFRNPKTGKETHEATLYHLLSGLALLERDSEGMKRWCDLLMRIVSNEWNLKYVTKQVVRDLTYHFDEKFLYGILIATTVDKFEKLSHQKLTIPYGSSHYEIMKAKERRIETYELQLIHSYLDAVELDCISMDLEKRLMRACYKTYPPETLEMVLEIIAMTKVVEKEDMLDVFRSFMANILLFDENVNVLDGIVKLCIKYGYVEINKIAKQAADLNTVMYGFEPVEGLMELLCKIVIQKETHGAKIILNTCKAMSDLILATDIVDTMYEVSRTAFVCLLFRWAFSDPSTYDGPLDAENVYEITKPMFEITAVLSFFFPTFAAKSKTNQVFIKDCFKLFYNFKPPCGSTAVITDMEFRQTRGVALHIAKFTSNAVPYDNQISLVHLDFLREAVDWILDENESENVRKFASIIMPFLDITGAEEEELKQIKKKLERACLLDERIVVTSDLKLTIEKIDKAIEEGDEVEELSRAVSGINMLSLRLCEETPNHGTHDTCQEYKYQEEG